MPFDAPGQIWAIGALQHEAFNRCIPRAITQRLQIADLLEGNDVGKIHALRLLALIPVFQPRATFGKGQGAQILSAIKQNVVKPDRYRVIALHLGGDGLAVQPLLNIGKGRHCAISKHQQFAIQYGVEIKG